MQEKAGKAFSLPATKRLLFVAGFAHLQGIQALSLIHISSGQGDELTPLILIRPL